MLQTAEGIRKQGFPDWMQLVGLIHDMGKVMFLWGNEADGQVGKNSNDLPCLSVRIFNITKFISGL